MKVGIEAALPAAGEPGGAKTASKADQGFKSLLDKAQAAGTAKETKDASGQSEEPAKEPEEEKTGQGEGQAAAAALPELPGGWSIPGKAQEAAFWELIKGGENPPGNTGGILPGNVKEGQNLPPVLKAEPGKEAPGPEGKILPTEGGAPKAFTAAATAVPQAKEEGQGAEGKQGTEEPVDLRFQIARGAPGDESGKEAGKADAAGRKNAGEPAERKAPGSGGGEAPEAPSGNEPYETVQVRQRPAVHSLPRESQGSGQETAWRLHTGEAALPKDLGEFLVSRLPAKGQELIVELEPEALGKLTIRAVYENDRALVSILTENSRTLELLNRHCPQLAAILEENTGRATIVYMRGAEDQPQDGFERQGQSQDNPQQDRQREQEQRRKQDQTESFSQRLRLGLI